MKSVLVVGNGFDIALGFYTKYSDFVNTRAGNGRFWPFLEAPSNSWGDNSLHSHFYEFFKNNSNNYGNIHWIDIEGELLKYARSKIGTIIPNGLPEQDKSDWNNLKFWIYKYIGRIVYETRKNPDEKFINLMEAIRLNGNFKIAYSFNYTNLCYELSNYLNFSESELPKVNNIHGSTSNKEDPYNIVLGINEDFSIPNEYHFLFKSEQTQSNDFVQDLVTSDDILLYGLSLGETDFPYFRSFFEYVASQPLDSPKKYITICTYGKESVISIKNRIRTMGIDILTLQQKSYFAIIDIGNLWLPGLDENNYNSLLSRLKDSALTKQPFRYN